MLYMQTRFQVLWMKKCTNLCQISKFQSRFPCSNMDLNEMFYISEAVPPNNKDILAWEYQPLNFMREGERGKRGGVSVSWTHFKVIVLDMSFREHPSNHINKRLDALGGWKEIWISHWCIILTHFLTWVWDGEGFLSTIRGSGTFLVINTVGWTDSGGFLHTHKLTYTHTQKQMAEGWKWWMQCTN